MNKQGNNDRVAVVQLGARRHYAVPLALESAGMLERFYTDFYFSGRIKRGLCASVAAVTGAEPIRRMLGRYAPGLTDGKVVSFNKFGIEYRRRGRAGCSATERTRNWLWGGDEICRLVLDSGTVDIDTFYAYTSASCRLFEAAKERGVCCILDHATAPKLIEDRLVEAELSRWPQWFPCPERDEAAEEYMARQRSEWELADRIICNSSFVQRMIAESGGPTEKTTVVPLGISITGKQRLVGTHNELHVLFVGDDGLRKGLGTMVQACRSAGLTAAQTRVAGNIELSEQGRRELPAFVTMLGAVPRSEMSRHYDWADVLVLPSVSDTFAIVVLEAMAAGLPVIVTPQTGAADVVRDGLDGFIVPAGDPEKLAALFDRLASEPGLLCDMGRSARECVEAYSMSGYSKRLSDAVSGGSADE